MTKRWYGRSSISRGSPEDPERCVTAVWPAGMWHDHQCTRKRGHGPDGLYCKQHAKNERSWILSRKTQWNLTVPRTRLQNGAMR